MVMRYNNGKWTNDVMPEDLAFGGSFSNTKVPGMTLNGMGAVGSAPTWQYNKDMQVAAPSAPEASQPSNWASSGVGATQLSQLLNQTSSPSAPSAYAATPTGNSFADPMKQYLASGAPQAPTGNSFADPLKQYLGSAAPTADKATMGTNRYAGGLTQAEQRLQDLITNPGALEQSAAYKFRLNQGQEALQRSMGAKGMLQSGNRLMELTKYGQDMGSQEYEAENARRKALLDSYSGNYNTDQANNTARFGAESAANNARFGIQSDLYKARGTQLSDLYKGENANNTNLYATAADLYGRQGQTLASLYGNENQANTARYATDVGAATNRYGVDVGAASDRAKTLADLYRTDQQANVAMEEYKRPKLTNKAWWA